MNCSDCRYERGCDRAYCYYDHIREQREAQPGYDEKKWYMVDECSGCAYIKVYSQREVDEYHDKHPEDDLNRFYTKEQIEEDPAIKWETDEYWRQRGQQDAREIIEQKGIEEVFSWWKGYDRDRLMMKREQGFFDELMKLAKEAGLTE